jgi:hypothetical protein
LPKIGGLPEALVGSVAENEMIEDGNIEILSALQELLGQGNIFRAGVYVARGVIVVNNSASCTMIDDFSEYVAGMGEGFRRGADSDDLGSDKSVFDIQKDDGKAFLGLPHQIKFINDLSVEISLLGQDLDFDNLSRGERTRLILGLSWAFRDIFENTNHAINLVFVDELLDAGMDSAGLEGSLEILKKMERERNKNVFVISHREELINRVTSVLTVVKESGFTRFDWEYITEL